MFKQILKVVEVIKMFDTSIYIYLSCKYFYIRRICLSKSFTNGIRGHSTRICLTFLTYPQTFLFGYEGQNPELCQTKSVINYTLIHFTNMPILNFNNIHALFFQMDYTDIIIRAYCNLANSMYKKRSIQITITVRPGSIKNEHISCPIKRISNACSKLCTVQ